LLKKAVPISEPELFQQLADGLCEETRSERTCSIGAPSCGFRSWLSIARSTKRYRVHPRAFGQFSYLWQVWDASDEVAKRYDEQYRYERRLTRQIRNVARRYDTLLNESERPRAYGGDDAGGLTESDS
jgi:hypothetical protein